MSPLVLNRFIRVGVYLVGIFVVFLGLNSCVTDPPDSGSVPQPGTSSHQAESEELAQNWWGKETTHSDTVLLEKEVVLETCFDKNKKQLVTPSDWNAPYKVGAFIHPRSIRKKSWDDKPFKFVGASIVPYIEGKKYNKKYLIMPPYERDVGKNYYVLCGVIIEPGQSYVGQSYVGIHPHYYPSMLFDNDFPINKDKIFKELKQQWTWQAGWIELTTTPVEINKSPLTMKELLQTILSYREGEASQSRVTAWTKQLNLPAGTKVRFNQLKHDSDFKLGYTVEDSGRDKPNADVSFKPTITKPTSTMPTTPTSHKVNITLPNDFVQTLGGANALIGKMTLVGCESANITKVRGSNNTFSANCTNIPTALEISGFRQIATTGITDSNGAITFDVKSKDIPRIIVGLIPQVAEGFKVNETCAKIEDNRNKLSFDYTCIGKKLSFKHYTLRERCALTGTPQFDSTSLGLTRTNCYVKLKSPFKLLVSPTNNECNFLSNRQKDVLRCDLSNDDFEAGINKTFNLNWGKGWEKVSLKVNIMNETYQILRSEFKPIWPFTNMDRTSTSSFAYQTAGTPSCDVSVPKYAIVGSTTTYPTLEEQRTGTPLPTTISVEVKQQPQSGKIAKAYKETATISWKPSEVTAVKWDLLSKFASELKEKNSTVTFTADSSLRGNIFQYESMEACLENPKHVQGLGYYYPDETNLTVNNPCASFRLKDTSGKLVSHCAQVSSGNRVFFQSHSCGEKRKLVVISTDKSLDKYGGRPLKKSLIRVLQKTKTTGEKIPPFTVVTLNSGRAVSDPLLTCEDMGDGATASSKIGSLNFSAKNLSPLRDLELVHNVYKPEKLESVFYLVGDIRKSYEVDPMTDFTIPHGWKRKNISLTVLTTTQKSCAVWKSNGVKECHVLGTSRQNEKVLTDFLNRRKN